MTDSAPRPLALITGASSGIGKELARRAAAEGYDLVVVARGADRLHDFAAELASDQHTTVHVVPADLSEPGAGESVVNALGGLVPQVLVNNAGVGGIGKFGQDRDVKADLAMIQLNVMALVELTGLLLPSMIERGSGSVLNVASLAGFLPGPGQAVYYASKAFVLSFSEAIAYECKDRGVHVTALCPGPVETGFASAAGYDMARFGRGRPAMVPADAVAKAGWEGMKAGKTVVLPGPFTKLAAHGLRFAPRRLAAAIGKNSN